MSDDDFSQNPCAYCGDKPTWRVDWIFNDQTYEIWLCAECDSLYYRKSAVKPASAKQEASGRFGQL